MTEDKKDTVSSFICIDTEEEEIALKDPLMVLYHTIVSSNGVLGTNLQNFIIQYLTHTCIAPGSTIACKYGSLTNPLGLKKAEYNIKHAIFAFFDETIDDYIGNCFIGTEEAQISDKTRVFQGAVATFSDGMSEEQLKILEHFLMPMALKSRESFGLRGDDREQYKKDEDMFANMLFKKLFIDETASETRAYDYLDFIEGGPKSLYDRLWKMTGLAVLKTEKRNLINCPKHQIVISNGECCPNCGSEGELLNHALIYNTESRSGSFICCDDPILINPLSLSLYLNTIKSYCDYLSIFTGFNPKTITEPTEILLRNDEDFLLMKMFYKEGECGICFYQTSEEGIRLDQLSTQQELIRLGLQGKGPIEKAKLITGQSFNHYFTNLGITGSTDMSDEMMNGWTTILDYHHKTGNKLKGSYSKLLKEAGGDK